jgi:hypothetical protein
MRRLAFVLPIVIVAILLPLSLSGDLSPASAGEAPTIADFVANMESHPGLFNTYNSPEGRLFMEISQGQFEKDFLVVVQMAKGNGEGFLLTGFPLVDAMMTFRMVNTKIELIDRNPLFRATPGTPEGDMVNLGFRESVRESFTPVAKDTEYGIYLIDVTGLFVNDWPNLADILPDQYGVGFRLDPSRSELASVKGYPENVEIEADLTFASSGFIPTVTVPDGKTLPVSYHYSIIALPDEPMKPRLADDRIGFFTMTYKDYDQNAGPTDAVRLVNRWRLEKKDPYAPLSEPVKPIVYYLEKTIPTAIKPYIKQAVESWNAAFEQAGFKNAIVAMDEPDDPNFDLGDARYSSIRWVPAIDSIFAIGPSDADPRSGEILNADILVVSDWVPSITGEKGYLKNNPPDAEKMEKMIALARQINPEAAARLCLYQESLGGQLEMLRDTLMADGVIGQDGGIPIEYVGAALREIVMHEVGHTLGLAHNFKASTLTPQDKLQDVSYTQQHGVSASVMDYNPANISMDRSKQGEYYNSVVGSYDKWAIEWGYTPVGDETLAPNPALEAIASQDSQPGHLFGTDEDTGLGPFSMDPTINQYDMGDPLQYYQNLRPMVDSLWSGIEDRVVQNGAAYWPLRYAVHYLLFQQMRGYPMMAKALGGVIVSRVHKGNAEELTPLNPVSADQQRASLDYVLQAYRPNVLGSFPTELLDKMPTERYYDWASSWQLRTRFTYPLVDYITAVRSQVLAVAFNPERLMRIRDQSFASTDANPFTLGDLFDGFTNAIWGDVLSGNAPKDSLQREIQNTYLNMLIKLGSNESMPAKQANADDADGILPATHLPPDISHLPPATSDVHALAFAELVSLNQAITDLLAKGVTDKTSYAHLLEAQNRIEQALNAK